MLVLFSQVFDAVGALPALAAYDGYVNYLLPPTLVNIALTTAVGTGVAALGTAALLAVLGGSATARNVRRSRGQQ